MFNLVNGQDNIVHSSAVLIVLSLKLTVVAVVACRRLPIRLCVTVRWSAWNSLPRIGTGSSRVLFLLAPSITMR